MWILIQKLHKQNEILTKKLVELESVVHKDIKKINITEWLNKNIHVTLNYSEWLSELPINKNIYNKYLMKIGKILLKIS